MFHYLVISVNLKDRYNSIFGAVLEVLFHIFRNFPEHMKVSLSVNKGGKKIELFEAADVRDANLMFMIMWTGAKIESKRELAEFLLSMVLNAIDESRDARLLAQIYAKYDGFADKVESDMQIHLHSVLFSSSPMDKYIF